MKYSKDYLLSEIGRFIKENKRFPTSADIRVKLGMPPLSAYTSTFGSWSAVMEEYENNLFPIQTIEPDLIGKYTLICEQEIYKLWLKYPNISIEVISDIMQRGYDIGVTASEEGFDLEVLKNLYL